MSEGSDKVIELSRTRVCRAYVVYDLPCRDYELSFHNPVEVVADGKRIGWASVRTVSHESGCCPKLCADLVLDHASPERLTLETNSEPLYVRMGGVFETYDAPFEVVGALEHKTEIAGGHMTYLDISRSPVYEFQERIYVKNS